MPGGPDGDVTGLITLEDVMEELIGVRPASCTCDEPRSLLSK